MIEFLTALIAFLPMWLLQNYIHELSHGLAMRLGWKWSFKVWPFPSKKLGRFTWAHVIYFKTESSKEISKPSRGFVAIVPKIVNLVFILFGFLALMLSSGCGICSTLLLMFMFYNFIDYFVGLLSVFRSKPTDTDLWRFQQNLNIDKNTLRICVIASYILLISIIAFSTATYFIHLV